MEGKPVTASSLQLVLMQTMVNVSDMEELSMDMVVNGMDLDAGVKAGLANRVTSSTTPCNEAEMSLSSCRSRAKMIMDNGKDLMEWNSLCGKECNGKEVGLVDGAVKRLVMMYEKMIWEEGRRSYQVAAVFSEMLDCKAHEMEEKVERRLCGGGGGEKKLGRKKKSGDREADVEREKETESRGKVKKGNAKKRKVVKADSGISRKSEKKKSRIVKEKDGEKKYGNTLYDDHIDVFFNLVTKAAAKNRHMEGPCAIQSFTLNESPPTGPQYFSGKLLSCQIIHDESRSHYVMIVFDPKDKMVHLYDGLYSEDEDWLSFFTDAVCLQICAAYEHLAVNGRLFVQLETFVQREIEMQTDSFSCGYRCVGAALAMYQGKNPTEISYDLREIHRFFIQVVTKSKNGKLSWNEIEQLRLGRQRRTDRTDTFKMTLIVDGTGYRLLENQELKKRRSSKIDQAESSMRAVDVATIPIKKSEPTYDQLHPTEFMDLMDNIHLFL